MKVCKYFESKHFRPKSYLAQTFSNRAYPVACASSELLRACNRLFFFNHCSTKKAVQKVQTKCISACTAVWPSQPDKYWRARISGHLGKIARITPGFLWFWPVLGASKPPTRLMLDRFQFFLVKKIEFQNTLMYNTNITLITRLSSLFNLCFFPVT